MEPVVKKGRPYDSPRRREQAAATRRVILEAAQRLFERDGYAATSVPVIAEEAGVALKTIYVAFETKANLLRVLWEERLAGEEARLPVTERSAQRKLLGEPDPERKLRLLASHSHAVKSRSGALMEVIRNAGSVDTDIAALWEAIQTKLLEIQRLVIEQLDENNALADGLEIPAATDVLWTLNHPCVWQLLVGERGWTGEQYEQWLANILCSQLLRVTKSNC